MRLPRLVVTDVDGTLLRSDHTISSATRDTLARAKAAGVKLALASGRPAFGLRRLLGLLEIDLDGVLLIGLNGAEVADASTGRTLWDNPMPPQEYDALARHAQDFEVTLMVPSQGRLYVQNADGFNVAEELAANGEELVVVPDLRLLPAPAYKLLMAAPGEYLARHHRQISDPMSDRFEFSFSVAYYYEATRRGTDKGSTLTQYCRAQGIPMADVVAFGDNHNDLAMLAQVGVGVAMANGVAAAKTAAATVTTAGNNDDGVARFLVERYGI